MTIVGDAVNIRSRAAEHTRTREDIEPAGAALADLYEAAAAATKAESALTRVGTIDLAGAGMAAAGAETDRQRLDEDVDSLNERAAQLTSVLSQRQGGPPLPGRTGYTGTSACQGRRPGTTSRAG